MCVLIVEDDLDIVLGLCVLLCWQGYVVDYVDNGVYVDVVLGLIQYVLLVLDLGLL